MHRDEEPNGGTAPSADCRRRLEEIPQQLKQLRKSGQKRSSRREPESRYLRRRGGFCLGYTGEVAVSDDHLIVAQRVHQAANDNRSLAAMTESVKRECGEYPTAVLANCGYNTTEEIAAVEGRGVETYVPDKCLAKGLANGKPAGPMSKRQQQRFDRFCEEYNHERPHDALGQRPPATLYAAAERTYPTQIPEPEYPVHWERRRVRQDGRVKFQGRMYFLSEALAGETTGWVEVAEDIWQIRFGPVEVALYDAAERTLWPLGSAVSGPCGGR